MSREDRERVPDKQLLGIPSLQDFGAGAADGHLDFSIVVPMTGEAVLDALLTFGRAFSESGVDVGMGALTCFHPRALTFISSFPVLRDDREANRRTRETYLRCVALAAQKGWGQYRVHAAFMDAAAATYGFDRGALTRFHGALKDAVDPRGILAAGRYGIWPRHLRRDA
jgi:4-cresol dehydrogenase (hydroxylating)